MDIVGSRLSREEFESYVNRKFFGYLPADKLVLHHTWKPTVNDWKGYQTLMGIKNYYESLGWKSGPHVFIAPDGIWLMTDMRNNGTHAGSLNWRSIGIEVVGNYDNKTWEGEIYKNAIWAITTLKKKLNIDNEKIYFHRDVSNKTCPGSAITKKWLFDELDNFKEFGFMELNYNEEREIAYLWLKEMANVTKTPIGKNLANLDVGWLSVVLKRLLDKKGL